MIDFGCFCGHFDLWSLIHNRTSLKIVALNSKCKNIGMDSKIRYLA